MSGPSKTQKIERTPEQINEIRKCAADVVYFAENYAWIPHPIEGLIRFKPYPYQKEALRAFQDEQFIIVNKSRQLGFSTVTMVYSLWLALFHRNKNIVSLATKLATAQNYISRLRESLKKIPDWLFLTEFASYSKKEISFTNGSIIRAVPTSESSNRGDSLSVLVLDECVDGSTQISIRNKETLKEYQVTIQDFFEMI